MLFSESIELSVPANTFRDSYRSLVMEFEQRGEKLIPFILDIEKTDFSKFLKKLDLYKNGIELPKGFVPHSSFFLTREDYVIGVVNIRHTLTSSLEIKGGHIGYGIRPSERSKGYGRLILRYALSQCRLLGIDKVLVTCDKTNVRSAKTILSNDGVLCSEEYLSSSDGVVQRYWIQNRN